MTPSGVWLLNFEVGDVSALIPVGQRSIHVGRERVPIDFQAQNQNETLAALAALALCLRQVSKLDIAVMRLPILPL